MPWWGWILVGVTLGVLGCAAYFLYMFKDFMR